MRSSGRSDRLASSGFQNKMCDVSVKRLTMGLLACLCESFDRLVGKYWYCLPDVYLTSVVTKVSLISISCHRSEFDLCSISCHRKREFNFLFNQLSPEA